MKQVVQEVRSGRTSVRKVPDPLAQRNEVLIASVASLISAGTEKYVVELARKSLIGKAKDRPDHVRRVLQKLKQEGFVQTATQVMAKLDEPMPLGYSSAGVVLECGAAVQELKPGDRVAAAAPHAGIVAVGKNLCARIPEGVTFEQAAYTSVASIGLEGVRLARVTLGERVLVIGLGLIGQICVALLKAQGCRVFGTDIDAEKLTLAKSFGCDEVATGSPLDAVRRFSDGHGVDAVVITAATASNAPIEFAAEACRTRGRIVLVGVVGLNLPRPPFFKKELEFTVSSSLGPGRGDPAYEEKGIDYPIGHARWTAQRNMQAVLDVIAQGKLPVERLTTHRFPIDRAEDAYDLITSGRERYLGILLEYGEPKERTRTVRFASRPASGGLGVSLIGIGNFARLVMLPALKKAGGVSLRGVASAKGMTAEHHGDKLGFAFATTDVQEILADSGTNAVFILTRHNLHADLVVRALRAGKNAFVEKPLCINLEELKQIADCVEELGPRCPVLTVGFNRRFAPAAVEVKRFFKGIAPLTAMHRFASGYIPPDAWPQDMEIGGGRIIGEACHAIDTCTALVGSAPVEVFARSIDFAGGVETSDDQTFITLKHRNGSVSSISYQAGGDKAFPAERVEVFGGGQVGVIDNWGGAELWSGGRARRQSGRDKGHAVELAAFVAACRTGEWPIPWDEIYAVSWASIAALQSIRDGMPHRLEEIGA